MLVGTLGIISPASSETDAAREMMDNYETGDSSLAFADTAMEPGGSGESACGAGMADTTAIRGPFQYRCRRTMLARDTNGTLHKFSATACRHGNSPDTARISASSETSFMIDGYQREIRKAQGIADLYYFRDARVSTRCTEMPKDGGSKEAYDETGDNEAPEPPASHPTTANFHVVNKDRYTAGVRLFSHLSGEWRFQPGLGRQYNVQTEADFSMACEPNEKICVGAWRNNQNVEWGSGRVGTRGCERCCVTCGGNLDFTLGDGGTDKGPPPATFILHNHDRSTVAVRFYSSRGIEVFWPNRPPYNYFLPPSSKTYRLSCTAGEKVCWGAWRELTKNTWGTGRLLSEGCTDCCMTCGGTKEWTIEDGGEDRGRSIPTDDAPVTSAGGGGDNGAATRAGIEALGAVLNGLARGRGGGGGVPTVTMRPTGGGGGSGYGPAPPRSESGISPRSRN